MSAGVCLECSAGTHASAGAVACLLCEAGTYSAAEVGSATCSTCPPNRTSAPRSGDLNDCKCAMGYTGAGGSACSACEHRTFKNWTGPGQNLVDKVSHHFVG